ncbi:MAG: PQQ-binding-like beta-propeller repeat protein [Planctomycetaceae bacterium]|nr:PQQ-binding-like beta-propeller repeat protein [Planctomycetaceae bacterium]
MASDRPIAWVVRSLLAVAILSAGRCGLAPAQAIDALGSSRFELAEAVEVDLVDNATRVRLEKAKALLADRQWDEAIEILRQLAETPSGKLVHVTPQRFINLQDWCQQQLRTLPPEGLRFYRARVDPVVAQWYERGIAARDRSLLQNVVDRAAASSYGDRALLTLGDIALESGDFAAARSYWKRIAASSDPNLQPALQARLVLVSILNGERPRAQTELANLRRSYPDAKGRLGGRNGKYVELLQTVLDESAAWSAATAASDWLTFAGNPERSKVAPPMAGIGAVAWRMQLASFARETPAFGDSLHRSALHPVLVGDLLLVNDAEQIVAIQWRTGKPAWGGSTVLYRSGPAGANTASHQAAHALGTPQYTMTVRANRLYARMGSALVGQPEDGTAAIAPGCLVCLDLASQGRLLWKVTSEEGWTLEGSPLADAQNVYIAMRRRDARPRAAVACFDAGTGRLRWRRFVVAAEMPGQGLLPSFAHNLLALAGGTLYLNTNLGAVAALRAEDGRILWVSLYPRALRGDLAKLATHWHRAPNPCVLRGEELFVAPSDSPGVFGFDAATGQMLWKTGTEVEDALHLLGATDDWLIAGGSRLYWIGLRGDNRGRVKHVWPSRPEPCDGRGLLAGDCVLWPTRDKLYAIDSKTAQQRDVFNLGDLGVTGGNLLVAKGRLLIATDNDLTMIEPSRPTP